MSRNRIILVVGLMVAFSMLLASCTPATTATAVPTIPPTAEPTAVPARQGGWLDQIVFSVVSSDSAVTQIQAGAIDVFAYGLASAQFPEIQAAGLKYAASMGTYYVVMHNPAVCDDATAFNPFSDRRIREATNMLYDRNYINQEVYAGGALPKLFLITTNGIDYADLADIVRSLEAKYAFNETKAIEDIKLYMEEDGATLGADGKWTFGGKPIVLIYLIRNDGDKTRLPIGDYTSSQLEKAGFTVDRQYKKSSEASPIWLRTKGSECLWNLYTAGWGSTGLSRDDRDMFQQMFLPTSGQASEPFFSNVNPDPAYQKLGDDLANAAFTTVEQRKEMMGQALALSLQDSLQVGIVDTRSFAPFSTSVQMSYNLAAGIERAAISYYTARFVDQEGGVLKFGESDLFTEPWNQIAGSNWAWDQGAQTATASSGLMPDPYTGLQWPLRAERAELVAQTGLPIFKSLDWIELSFADTIAVPADAWVDWDAATQTFIPAGDGITAKLKSTIFYPADMFDTVTWHNGAPLSVADFVMAMILNFDRAKEDSAIYDPDNAVPNFESFMSSFKGVKIVSTDPLVIETYSDNYSSDAELDITTWWPYYGFGEASWDVIAVANLAEAAGECAYSFEASSTKAVEQTSIVGGPTLAILDKYLDEAIAANTIPYAPTMGAYLTAEEAAARYAALKQWYTDRGHFVVGTGPYYLYKAFLVEKSLILQNYSAYPDSPDRWSGFAEPKIAVVDIVGPAGSVKIGDPATFDASVTFGGQPYPSAELKMVKYLLYDATGALVKSDLATLVSEGNYQVVLPGDVTAALAAGSNKLELAVVSNVVAVPTFQSVQFVTAP